MARSSRIDLRCTDEELSSWRYAAEAAGLTLSAWIRRRLGLESGFSPMVDDLGVPVDPDVVAERLGTAVDKQEAVFDEEYSPIVAPPLLEPLEAPVLSKCEFAPPKKGVQ